MKQGVYPYNPTSHASLLRSYIAWESRLITMYEEQSKMVEEPGLSRMLLQLGLESITHLRRFESWLEKLGPEGEAPLAFSQPDMSKPMLDRFHHEVDNQYKMVLQHLRHAFVFAEENCPTGGELELTAMRHMKHLSHFAEDLAAFGEALDFRYPGVDESQSLETALKSDLEMTIAARARFEALRSDPELQEHPGLRTELENMITRNEFLANTLEGMLSDAPTAPAESKPSASASFTVGSLIHDQGVIDE
jgi:bacterioferritin (cytochrome b1)